MISLLITRANLAIPNVPLTIGDAGTDTYVLQSISPGARVKDNAYAESKWIDGAQLVSSRQSLLSLELVIQVRGASVQALIDAAAVLDDTFDQSSFTITQTVTGSITPTVYTCLPANTNFGFDPVLFRAGLGIYTASIPRQP